MSTDFGRLCGPGTKPFWEGMVNDQYAGWLVLNTVSSALLLMMFGFQMQNPGGRGAKQFMQLTLIVVMLVVLDSLPNAFRGQAGAGLALSKIGNWGVFAFDPLCFLASIRYVDCYVQNEGSPDRKYFIIPGHVFCVVNFVLVTVSVLAGWRWFYYYEGTEYFRGFLFTPRALLLMVMCIMVEVYIIYYRYNISKVFKIALCSLPALSLAGTLLQIVLPGLSVGYAFTAFACLLLLVLVQRNDSSMDYLTGVMNRRGLENVMKREFEAVDVMGTFAAVMVDVDFFKEINDNHSHQLGDNVLAEVAGLLRRAGGNNAEIGRYGGDEFMMIVHVNDPRLLQEIVDRVRAGLAEINSSGRYPFEISLSLGYSVFDKEKTPTLQAFQKLVDSLMYEEKKIHHQERGVEVR